MTLRERAVEAARRARSERYINGVGFCFSTDTDAMLADAMLEFHEAELRIVARRLYSKYRHRGCCSSLVYQREVERLADFAASARSPR